MILIALCSYQICILTHQSVDVSNYAFLFAIYQIPGITILLLTDFIVVYLNSQEIFEPLLIPNICACGLHFLFSHFISAEIEFYGIIISTNLTYLCQLILVIIIYRIYNTIPI